MSLEPFKAYYDKYQQQMLDSYFTFLRFQSISTDPSKQQQVLDCYQWLVQQVKDIGFEVETWEGEGNPILFANSKEAGDSKPTLLFYHHYDVQPTDPDDKWNSPPFEATLKDGKVFARGAQDNKGQCFYTLCALKAYKELVGSFPINIKLLIEGEEEVGSPFLSQILPSKKEKLQTGAIAIVDTLIPSLEQPAVTVGMRGNFSIEVVLKGSHSDLHSGIHGGLAYNPLHALVQLLAKLRNEKGQVLIPGFYEGIQEPSVEELAVLDLSIDPHDYFHKTGAKAMGGEIAFPPGHRNTLRPTLEINGVAGGYAGEGFKTVIPSEARAKISARLVKGQDPHTIIKQLENMLRKECLEGISLEFIVHATGGKAVMTSPFSSIVTASQKALKTAFEKDIALSLCGASIPIASELNQHLQADIVGLGMGLDTDNIHAPNEHFSLERFRLGFLSIAALIDSI